MMFYRTTLGLLAAILVGSSVACDSQETNVLADPAFEDVGWIQRGVGVQYTIASNGVRSSILVADTAFSFGPNGADSTIVVGMLLQVFDENGASRATIRSDRAWMDPETRQLEARGGAELHIPSLSRLIQSEKMYFDYAGEGSVQSDLFTRMIDESETVCGTGFRSDLNFTSTEIHQLRTGPTECGG